MISVPIYLIEYSITFDKSLDLLGMIGVTILHIRELHHRQVVIPSFQTEDEIVFLVDTPFGFLDMSQEFDREHCTSIFMSDIDRSRTLILSATKNDVHVLDCGDSMR
jgi:hypothetical protein